MTQALATRLFAEMRRCADHNGNLAMNAFKYAALLDVEPEAIRATMSNSLVRSGCVERLGPGFYHLTGKPFATKREQWLRARGSEPAAVEVAKPAPVKPTPISFARLRELSARGRGLTEIAALLRQPYRDVALMMEQAGVLPPIHPSRIAGQGA